MIKYSIKSQNLNNSLVFYRALFNRMPDDLGIDYLRFYLDQFQLEIEEGKDKKSEILTMETKSAEELNDVLNRMTRFLSKERLNENCERISHAFGLIDPDGNHWRIGDPDAVVQFKKCYVTN